MTCRICREDEGYRKTWGCDGPADDTVFRIDCPFCNDDGCPECNAEHKIEFDRCPHKLITVESARLMGFYSHYKNGFLAGPGGIGDQTIGYQRAMQVLGQLDGRMQRTQAETMKKEAARAQARRQAGIGR